MTTTVLNTKIENKILDVSGLVKKADHNAKILNIEAKCFTTSDCDKFKSKILETKIKQANLAANQIVTLMLFHNRANKKKENKEKLQTFDSIYFLDKNFFGDHGFQNMLAFKLTFSIIDIK